MSTGLEFLIKEKINTAGETILEATSFMGEQCILSAEEVYNYLTHSDSEKELLAQGEILEPTDNASEEQCKYVSLNLGVLRPITGDFIDIQEYIVLNCPYLLDEYRELISNLVNMYGMSEEVIMEVKHWAYNGDNNLVCKYYFVLSDIYKVAKMGILMEEQRTL